MGLVDVLIPLTILGMGRVGWVPLTSARTPVPDVSDDVPSASIAVASAPMALTTSVIMPAAVSLPHCIF